MYKFQLLFFDTRDDVFYYIHNKGVSWKDRYLSVLASFVLC